MAGRPIAVPFPAVAVLFILFKSVTPFSGTKIDLKVKGREEKA